MVRRLAKALATFCCAVFFGAAAYISLVQHPAALETGNEFAVRFFTPMYRRAALMQASLAIIGAISSIAAYLLAGGRAWLLSAVLIAGVVPYTLLIVEPINQEIQTVDPSAGEAVELLMRWGWLHWVRTLASGIALAICLIAMARTELRIQAPFL